MGLIARVEAAAETVEGASGLAHCGSEIEALEGAAHDIEATRFVVSDAELEAVKTGLQRIRSRTQEWMSIACESEGKLDPGSLQTVRSADASGRVIMDRIVEADPARSAWLPTPGAAFAGGSAKGDALEQLDILCAGVRTGDVLITRAPKLSSAGVAHFCAEGGQYSHTLVVSVEPDGVHVVAAYMEHGATTQKLEDFLRENHCCRIAVVRHVDGDLAEEVGRAAFRRIAHGPQVPYDDVFDSNDPGELYCSEIPRWAYGELVGREPTLPRHPSPSGRRARSAIHASIGVDVPWLCSPVDYLVDPNLRLVAEWRDPAAIQLMRRQDAAIEAPMRWIDQHDYVLSPQLLERLTVKLGLAIRRLPVLGMALQSVAGADIRPQFLLGSLTLLKVAGALLLELEAELGDKTPTRQAMAERLDSLRERDLERWRRSPRRAVFHRWLHPASQ